MKGLSLKGKLVKKKDAVVHGVADAVHAVEAAVVEEVHAIEDHVEDMVDDVLYEGVGGAVAATVLTR
jgi:hypothetical protein